VRVQKYVAARNLILKLVIRSTVWVTRRREEANILTSRAVSTVALVLAGSMDWLTTVIGIACFGAVESNPFIAGIAGASLPAFTVVKLAATMFAGLLFYQGEKLLFMAQNQTSWSFRCTRTLLRTACIAATVFLIIAVVNNLMAIACATML